jgi:huntingtin interacting protein 1
MGTHHEQGCGTFWACTHRIQIEANRFVSWKFCYLFHKLMRDGHPNTLLESIKYKSKITELGKLWVRDIF